MLADHFMRLGFPKFSVPQVGTDPPHVQDSSESLSPVGLGDMGTITNMNTCPCKASVIEPFVPDLGVSRLLSALMKLTQAHLLACKKGEPWEPSQFFMF